MYEPLMWLALYALVNVLIISIIMESTDAGRTAKGTLKFLKETFVTDPIKNGVTVGNLASFVLLAPGLAIFVLSVMIAYGLAFSIERIGGIRITSPRK